LNVREPIGCSAAAGETGQRRCHRAAGGDGAIGEGSTRACGVQLGSLSSAGWEGSGQPAERTGGLRRASRDIFGTEGGLAPPL
jgi:hypothetical protein